MMVKKQAPPRKSVRFAGDALPSGMVVGRRANSRRTALTQELLALEEELQDRSALLNTLKMLPQKLSYETMVPLGKFAMMPGKLNRTNEILVDLGGGIYSWQSAYQAQVILCRRLNTLVEKADALKAEIIISAQQNDDEDDEDDNVNHDDVDNEEMTKVERVMGAFANRENKSAEFRLSLEEAEAIHREAPASTSQGMGAKVTVEEHTDVIARLTELAMLEEQCRDGTIDAAAELAAAGQDEDEQEEYQEPHHKTYEEAMTELDELERLEMLAEQEEEREKEKERQRHMAEEAVLDANAAIAARNAAANAAASNSIAVTGTPIAPPANRQPPVVIGRVVERSPIISGDGVGAPDAPGQEQPKKRVSKFKQQRKSKP